MNKLLLLFISILSTSVAMAVDDDVQKSTSTDIGKRIKTVTINKNGIPYGSYKVMYSGYEPPPEEEIKPEASKQCEKYKLSKLDVIESLKLHAQLIEENMD
ncbi:MAG: hypothetical protein FWF20_05910 [Betaproteobacteria bacterium]|nr:hypothetical protein [Betaproteobacteria bacterium]MCL2886307.1 hypothetical protein [Betaproteobacteria bacterium]